MKKIGRDRAVTVILFIITCVIIAACIIVLNKDDSVPAQGGIDGGTYVPIIMYHSLLKDESMHGKYVISPDAFEQDLAYLQEHGYTAVLISDLIAYVYDGAPLPDKPVVLTFDDGYYNNYLYAYPLLEKYDSKIVISIIGYYSQKYSDSGEVSPYYTHVTWDNIKEMTASGRVEILNHSYNMHSTSGRVGTEKLNGESMEQYAQTLKQDLSTTQALLSEKAGVTPQAFTYPFGAVSKGEEEIVRSMGFKATLSCENKMNVLVPGDPECLYGLNRFIRPDGIGSEEFFEEKVKLQEYFE